jgi:glycosyltransferase involved in cell wall biosynthesis
MMKTPSVSVIVPAYNRASWLPDTVASILRQTHPPAEVIIIDDGSTDDTEAVCARFTEPVRYIRQANSGAAAARNRGMSEATGEWFAFIDSDDLWAPNKLAVQLAAVARTGTRWSATDCVLVDGGDRPLSGVQGFRRAFPVFGDFRLEVEEFLGRVLELSEFEHDGEVHRAFAGDAYELFFLGNFALTSTALLHREVYAAVGGFDEEYRVAEDTEFFHRLAAAFPAAFVMSPLTRWRAGHEGRITSSGNAVRLIEEGMRSLNGAARLRPALSTADRAAYQRGYALQVRKLAYAHLSLRNGRASRAVLREGRSRGMALTPATRAIYLASLLPSRLLGGLHALKRRIRL